MAQRNIGPQTDGISKKFRPYRFSFIVGLLLFGAYIFVGVIIFILLKNWVDPQLPSQKKDLIQALSLLLGGTAGVAAAFGAWLQWNQHRTTTQENMKTTQENLALLQKGQITERFTRALDELDARHLDGQKT